MADPDYVAIKRRHTIGNGHDQSWREIALIDFDDMHARLDTRPLIKGMLEHEQVSLIIGDTGSGKTFFALDRALHIALGREWFGHPVSQGGVVYVAAEAGPSIFNRVAAFRQHYAVTDDVPFKAITMAIDLCHPDGDLNQLIDVIGRAEFSSPLALIEIDTLSRVLAGGDENSSGDMGGLLRSLDTLRDQLQCHVSAVHHFGKDSGRGPRGHSLLKADVDTVGEVERDKNSNVSTFQVIKQRDGETGAQFAFSLQPVELGLNQVGDPVFSCVIVSADSDAAKGQKRTKLSAAQARALQLLVNAIADHGEVPPANNQIPPNRPCVHEDLWRRYCFEGSISTSDKPNANRMAYERGAQALLAYNMIGK